MLRHPAPPNACATGAAGASHGRARSRALRPVPSRPVPSRRRCGLARARAVTGGHGLSRGDGPGRRGPVVAPCCTRPLPPWVRRGAGSGTRPRGPNARAEVRESGGCEPRGRPSVLRNTTRGHGLADRRNAGSNFTYCPAVIGGYYHRGAVGEVGSCESAPPRATAPRDVRCTAPPPRVPQRAYACLGGCPERPGAASHASPRRTEAHRSAPPPGPRATHPEAIPTPPRARDP
jgi:hypothetical protein